MKIINETLHLCNEINLSNVPETQKEFNSPSDVINTFYKIYNPNVEFTKQEFKEKIKKINEIIKETKKGSKENRQLKRIKQRMYKEFFRNKNSNNSKRSDQSNKNSNNSKRSDQPKYHKINNIFKNKEITDSEKSFLIDNIHTYSLIDVLMCKKTEWSNKDNVSIRQIGKDVIKVSSFVKNYKIYINDVLVSREPSSLSLFAVKIRSVSLWKFWYEKRLEILRTLYNNDPSFIDQVQNSSVPSEKNPNAVICSSSLF